VVYIYVAHYRVSEEIMTPQNKSVLKVYVPVYIYKVNLNHLM